MLWLLLALFVVFPMATLLARVVVDKGSFDLSGLVAVLTDRHQVRAFWNSLLLGVLVGLGGTLVGFLFAFTAARGRLPRWLLTAVDAAVLLPLVSPPFTTAIAMIFSFGPRGLITYDLLGLKGVTVYGLTSTLASEIVTYFPIAYLTLRPLLAAIDSNLEGMALSLGASRWRVFRTVTLPLCVPGLANAFLLLFAASLADFATPLILAGNQFPVLPTQAFLQITGLFDLRGGAALSLVLLVPALAVFLLQRYWVEPPLLRDGHRQGRGTDAVRQHLAGHARGGSSRCARSSRSPSCTSTCCCCTRRSSSRSAPTTRSRCSTTG